MSESTFILNNAINVHFRCDGPLITVRFVATADNNQVGRTFTFSRSEATELGKRIMDSGEWDEFPINETAIENLKGFGSRLRDYGISGC
ncbi:MAG TPA: hypothetical protein VFB79_03140 [Candidatus Angelobacter sp.]|nr:hypothetical protein [Candidatus Angelobacter sp.]